MARRQAAKKTDAKKNPNFLPSDKAIEQQRADLEAVLKEALWEEFLYNCYAEASSDVDVDEDLTRHQSTLNDFRVHHALGLTNEDAHEYSQVARHVVELFGPQVPQEFTLTVQLTRADRRKILANVDDYCTSEAARESIRRALTGGLK